MKKIKPLFFFAALLNLLGCGGPKIDKILLDRMEGKTYRDRNFPLPLPYRIYSPETEKDQTYPLILYLHGGTGRGRDNKKQLDIPAGLRRFTSPGTQKLYPSFVLAPQCAPGEEWLNHNSPSRPFKSYDWTAIPESRMMQLTIALIHDLLQNYPVDQNRIYVTGPSMGGSGTWDIITRYPELFAAAVPITGVSDPRAASRVKNVSIWAFHGEQDTISDVNNTRSMAEAVKAAGGNIRYTEYKNVGHNSWDRAYTEKELLSWLFSCKH